MLSSEQCGLVITSDISDVLATVAQLIKGDITTSSLPKSCMEIKQSSPVSPSGYYTISNGSGGSVVVYCNMDELYSCPSLEQTLKGFSSTLREVSNDVTHISSNLTGVSQSVAAKEAYIKVATSCQDVQNRCPECTSGLYTILAGGITEEYVYCTFEERCGIPGPWTRVSYLDVSDSSSVCSSGTQKFVQASATACGIQEYSAPTCVQISMSAADSYSQICGRVTGYQKGSPDAFLQLASTDDILSLIHI